jgi:hypothetical protein
MTYITLAVTSAVIRQVDIAGRDQRQIAIRDASPELLAQIQSANGRNRIPVPVNGEFELVVGDTGAIWSSHQTNEIEKADFNSLYDLLARRPDHSIRFSW